MDSPHLNYYLMKAIEWINPAVYLIGFVIALAAFVRSRKCGYLVFAVYFALVVFSLIAMPYINRLRTTDIAVGEQQKLDAAIQQAITQTEQQLGHPVLQSHNINLGCGPICLVIGMWLLGRREPRVNS
jgi:hypothetical protein